MVTVDHSKRKLQSGRLLGRTGKPVLIASGEHGAKSFLVVILLTVAQFGVVISLTEFPSVAKVLVWLPLTPFELCGG